MQPVQQEVAEIAYLTSIKTNCLQQLQNPTVNVYIDS